MGTLGIGEEYRIATANLERAIINRCADIEMVAAALDFGCAFQSQPLTPEFQQTLDAARSYLALRYKADGVQPPMHFKKEDR